MKRSLWQFGIGLIASLAASYVIAASPKKIETDWTWNRYYASSPAEVATTSTHAVTGVGFAYSIEAISGDVRYTVHFTTRTYDPSTGFSAIRSSTTVDVVTSGTIFSSDFDALTLDPSIVIHGHTAGTAKIRITYGEQRVQ